MSLRIVITRAEREGITPETIELEWEDQTLAPDGAHIVALVNSLIGRPADVRSVLDLPLATVATWPDEPAPEDAHLVGESMLAGDSVEIRAMGQRVIWKRSDAGTPAGTVSENVQRGDHVVNDRDGAGGVPVWRKR